jgi:parallel beta-helix repeat protein
MYRSNIVRIEFGLFFLLFVAFASAANFYVDNSASGSNNGTSWANAWKNFASINWSNIKPGDIIYISGGSTQKTYNEVLIINKSGTAGNPITIRKGIDSGHNGEVIISVKGDVGIFIRPQRYVTLSGFTLTGCDIGIYISGSSGGDYWEPTASSNIIVENMDIFTSYGRGVFIQTSDNIIVRNNKITTPTNIDEQTDGIYSQRSKNNIFENNYIVIYNRAPDPHNDAIQMFQDESAIVRGNYLAQVNDKTGNAQGLYASVMYGTSKFYNNVINLGNAQSNGILFMKFEGTGTVEIVGNTFYGLRPYQGIGVQDVSNPIIKNNIAYAVSGTALWLENSGSTQVSNNYLGNPNFVSISNLDFHLQSNSPAIDNGQSLTSPYNVDKDGVSRPQGLGWDMGAYEAAAVGAIPVAPSNLKIQ